MTTLLKKAFERTLKLTGKEQDELSRWLISELKSERKWEKAYSKSKDILDKLANKALDEYSTCKTKAFE